MILTLEGTLSTKSVVIEWLWRRGKHSVIKGWNIHPVGARFYTQTNAFLMGHTVARYVCLLAQPTCFATLSLHVYSFWGFAYSFRLLPCEMAKSINICWRYKRDKRERSRLSSSVAIRPFYTNCKWRALGHFFLKWDVSLDSWYSVLSLSLIWSLNLTMGRHLHHTNLPFINQWVPSYDS